MMPQKLKLSYSLNDVVVFPVSISLKDVVISSNPPALSLSDFYTEMMECDILPRS